VLHRQGCRCCKRRCGAEGAAPDDAEVEGYKSGAIVLAIMDPYGNDQALADMAKAGVSAFAMELMPRITRAQSMDVLSSQANLAGYQAVIEAHPNMTGPCR
jgi:NAD(P) transhydrogenase subunit alpha